MLSGSRPTHNIPEGSPLNPQHLHWGLENPQNLLVVLKSPCFYHVYSKAYLLLSLDWWLPLQCHCAPFSKPWSHPLFLSLGGRAYVCTVYMYTGTHSWNAEGVSPSMSVSPRINPPQKGPQRALFSLTSFFRSVPRTSKRIWVRCEWLSQFMPSLLAPSSNCASGKPFTHKKVTTTIFLVKI